MAGLLWQVTTGEISLTGGAAKCVALINAPTNQRVLITNITVPGKGTLTTATPVYVRVYRATDAGTTTAVTPTKYNTGDNETLQVTAGKNATVNPAVGDVIDEFYFHPQGGLVRNHLMARPYVVIGGGRIGIEMTAAENLTVLCTIEGEE